MLESLDVLIGLSVVMLIISMVVTLLNQAMLNLIASRSNNLQDGLADILELLDAGMTRKEAEAVANKTLLHPIIGGKIWSWVLRLPGMDYFVRPYIRDNVIHREEFVKLLLAFGASYQGVDDELVNNTLKKLDANIEAGVAAKNKADIKADVEKLKSELEKFRSWREANSKTCSMN